MANFDSGVASYIEGVAVVRVHFPVDAKGVADVSCRQCDVWIASRRRCGINGRITEYPERYVGSHCPLEIGDADGQRLRSLGNSNSQQGGG